MTRCNYDVLPSPIPAAGFVIQMRARSDVEEAWSWLVELVSSVGFLSAAFGAFAGAWAANRWTTRREITGELNATASAVGLCFAICNQALGIKEQLIRPLAQRYEAEQHRYQKFLAGPPGGGFALNGDLMTITPPPFPFAALEGLMFNKITARGRLLVAMTTLVTSTEGLNLGCKLRNDIINDLRMNPPAWRRA